METSCGQTSARACAPGPASFNPRKLLLFLPIGLLLAGLVGGVAARAQEDFAPLGLFPLLVGVVLGGLLVIVMRVTNSGHRATVILVTLAAIVGAVAAEHYACYLLAVRARQAVAATSKAASMAQAAFADELGAPTGLVDYLQRESKRERSIFRFRIASGYIWATDALLLAASALAVVRLALRLPYCDRCQTWYRATRIGRVKPANGLALAAAAQVALPEKPHAIRFRLLTCLGGCGPVGLDLAWRDEDGQPASTVAWLAHDASDRIVQLLNQPADEAPPALNP